MKILSPLKAIRKNCFECAGRSWNEVKLCVIPDCPLFPYRFGHDPRRTGVGRHDGQFKRRPPIKVGGFDQERPFKSDTGPLSEQSK